MGDKSREFLSWADLPVGGGTAVGVCTTTLLKGSGVYKDMEDQITRYMERKK